MDTETRIFLRKKFQEFYSRNRIPAPREIEKREFGIGTLDAKIRIRHKSFKSEKELWNYLRRDAPFYISYSTAYYEFPENQPMKEKKWLGADLVFDLDIDMDLLDSRKLDMVKEEAINLIEILTSDFGFSENKIEINFSGSKGYHIHVLDEEIRDLGSEERREIVDYVSGNIDFKDYLMFEIEKDMQIIKGPKKGDKGWFGRIYNGLYNFIKNSDMDDMEKIKGIGEKRAKMIHEQRERILNELESGRYDRIPEIVTIERTLLKTSDPNVRIPVIKKVTSPLVQKIIDETAIKNLATRDADRMVTTDTSRLIRLPDTLHGNSGLRAKRVKDMERFDPLTDAIAFGDERIEIELKEKVPEFEMNGNKFGPFSPGTLKVQEYAGIYLLLNGFGNLSKS